MDMSFLEVSQMLYEHPILYEKFSYKVSYINILEYFVQKYSKDDVWANAALHLYIDRLLDNASDDYYNDFNLRRQFREVIGIKFKPFKFFTYRYCLLFDCIFINAYFDKAKGEKIFSELLTIYHKRYHKNIRRVFNFLYDMNESIDDIDNVQYMKECWKKNKDFLSIDPIRIMVTANMSAGKSTLLNALVGKKVNKTQNDACTAKIHYIMNKPFDDNLCYKWDNILELDADYQTLMEDNPNNLKGEISVGTYFRTINSPLKRLLFIDTPGVNSSQDKDHKEITENTILFLSAKVDLLIYLLNGENIGTDDEKRHLLFILENYHGKILFVVNKVDRFRKKEDSVSETIESVIRDLSDIGFETPQVVPISAYAAFLAKMNIFGEKFDEDEQDEFDRMVRKLRKEEYQFDTYYPYESQKDVQIQENDDSHELLLHSGILQLENIIYNLRG